MSSHVTDFNARKKNLNGKLHFSIRAIGIINFEKRVQNFIAETKDWFQNSMSD